MIIITSFLKFLTVLAALLAIMAGVSAAGFRYIESFGMDRFPFQSQELIAIFYWLAGLTFLLAIVLFLREGVWWQALGRPVQEPSLLNIHPPFRPKVYTTKP